MFHLIDLRVTEHPKRHCSERCECKKRRAACEAIGAVGQVHAVTCGHDHQHCQDAPTNGAEIDTDRIPTSERDLGLHVGECDHQHREQGRYGELPCHLGPGSETKVTFALDLDPVV